MGDSSPALNWIRFDTSRCPLAASAEVCQCISAHGSVEGLSNPVPQPRNARASARSMWDGSRIVLDKELVNGIMMAIEDAQERLNEARCPSLAPGRTN